MHNISKCKKCYQNKGKCEAFQNKKNPILNEEGECNGAIYTEEEYQELLNSLQ